MIDCAFEALRQRLDHPDRVVRLRTAQELARLLSKSGGEKYLVFFLEWLQKCPLEMDTVNGLSVIAMAKIAHKLNFQNIRQYVGSPSVLSEYLLGTYCGEAEVHTAWMSCHSGPPPSDFFEPDGFRRSAGQAGPILLNEIERVETISGFPLVNQWAWEWMILRDNGWPVSFSPARFSDDARTETQGSFEPRACDVVRSAFLKALACACETFGMPKDVAFRLATLCIPVYPHLACIEFSEPPDIWGDGPLEDAEALAQWLERLGAGSGDIVAASQGRWAVRSNSLTNLDVRAVLINKGQKISPEEVWDDIDISKFHVPKDDPLSLPVRVNDVGSSEEVENSDIHPLVFRYRPLWFPRWQLEFMLDGCFMPIPFGDTPIDIRCENDGIKYQAPDLAIGKCKFWLKDWKPTYYPDSGPNMGSHLTLSREIVHQWCSEFDCDLYLFGRAKNWLREKSYGDYQSAEFFSDCRVEI